MKELAILIMPPIFAEDGYKARIEMEIEILREYFSITLLIPEKEGVDINFKYEVTKEYYHMYYNNPFRYILAINSIRKTLNNFLKNHAGVVIYGEGTMATYLCASVSNAKYNTIVFDCHGTEPNERMLYLSGIKGKLAYIFFKYLEDKASDRADLIVVVSNKQYKILKTKKTYVKLPMLPSKHFMMLKNKRNLMRSKLGIPLSSTVYVYSGSDAIWQMCEETVALYKLIEESYEDTFFLVLTGAVEYFNDMIRSANIFHYHVIKVPYNEVPEYLDIADYGFCIRDDNLINNVASPTKILEYLSRNVKPIITDCIGDFSNELKSKSLACVLNKNLNNVDVIEKSLNFDGYSYVKTMREKYVEEYVSMLKNL